MIEGISTEGAWRTLRIVRGDEGQRSVEQWRVLNSMVLALLDVDERLRRLGDS